MFLGRRTTSRGAAPLLSTIILIALVCCLATACPAQSLIIEVSLSQSTISPNGDGVADQTSIAYRLSRDCRVTIRLIDEQGREYYFRRNEPRSVGSYAAIFGGAYAPDETKADRRVLPNGAYRVVVGAEDAAGHVESVAAPLVIEGADTTPPLIQNVICLPCDISPNKDAVDDEAIISYALTKKATVSLYATAADGSTNLMEAPNVKAAALHSHRWDGTSGQTLLPDGPYVIHIRAEDTAGNVSEATLNMSLAGGGTPRLDIVKARFYPIALPIGGDLNVELQVKNTGQTLLRTMGPPPGTAYSTDINYNAFKDAQGVPLYFEQAGYWRLGVDWGLAGRPYPVRWGLGKDLAPGDEATITGTIKININQTREVYFWAGVVQEGIGFPGDQVGIQRILISY